MMKQRPKKSPALLVGQPDLGRWCWRTRSPELFHPHTESAASPPLPSPGGTAVLRSDTNWGPGGQILLPLSPATLSKSLAPPALQHLHLVNVKNKYTFITRLKYLELYG